MKIATTFTPINLAGIVSAAAYIYLALHSQAYAEVDLVEFWRASGVCILMCFATWYYYHKTGRPISVTSLLAWALIFRCIGVFAYPILEDDFFRYLWDARMLVEYGSPYGVTPADSFSVDEPSVRFEEILSSINYPDISTVYGPVTQWSFAFGYLLAPGQIWPLQLLYAALDFSAILLLLRLAPAKYVLLYAWCPLLIKEFSFTAHPDILGVFFMLAAIIMIRKDCWYRAALLLALAVGSKIFALLMVPLLIGLRWRIWLLFGVTLLCITLPFLPTNPWLNGGLGAMTDLWLFNAPIYLALSPLVSGTWIKLSLLLTFILIWCAYAVHHFRTGNGQIPRGDWVYGIFLLCAPVVNAWYLVWLLPFAVIYPSRWAWVASVSVLLSYAVGLNLTGSSLGAYELPVWIITLEYGVILLALLIDLRARKKNTYPLV